MTTQGSLFATRTDATTEPNRPPTRSQPCEECGEPRKPDAKPGRFCSPLCRITNSEKRRAGYLAPRPLPEEPEAQKEIGIAIAVSNHRHEVAFARAAALLCIGERGTGIISHVREWAAKHGMDLPWEQNWTGGVFSLPPKSRPLDWWFEWCGRAATFHDGSKARWVNEYRLTAAGRAAYQRAKELTGR